MSENVRLTATARVKITKYDEHGNHVGVEEHTVDLTEEEAKALWHSQPQE